MSSRQLRKLQKQREVQEISEDSGDEQPSIAPKPRVSLFAALGGDENDVQDETEEEQEPEETVSEVKSSPAATKGKKKNKKKKKSKAKTATPHEDEDDIDKAIRELNITRSKSKNQSTTEDTAAQTNRSNKVLMINQHHLKVDNEMRNLFGRDAMKSAAAEAEEESRTRNRQGQGQQTFDIETFLRNPRNAPKLPEVSLRRNPFIQGRDYWPKQSAGGLTIEEIAKAEDGSSTEYTYMHDQNYDTLQACFFGCVQIGDPKRMIHLLKEAPYHVSTLLQVSSIVKGDNRSFASELCERALFTFGRVTTNAFRQNMEQGKARLDFRRPENRQLWLAGYHYLKSLVSKGTYRTALEWAKLLFSFDPQDPYAMRHFIHVLAIRAHEATWLIDFMDVLEEISDNRDTIYIRQSLVLAHLQLGDTARATEELEKGMKRVPWLYCALFQALGLDTPPSIWGISADIDARAFWEKLYIHQAKDLWNNPQATTLLKEVAKSLEKVDTSVLPSNDSPPDQGVTRLVFLEGETSLMALAPRAYLEMQPNYEFDPMPPSEEDNIFTGTGTRLPWDNGGHHLGPTPEVQARMHEMFAPHARAGGVAFGGQGEGDSDDDAERAAILDDEELRRDLQEAAQSGGAAGGFLERLMQMLGVAPGPTAERLDENDADQERDTDTDTEYENDPEPGEGRDAVDTGR
ncbi:hypothetical protein ACHAP5_009727 [Fusarium lateritium]